MSKQPFLLQLHLTDFGGSVHGGFAEGIVCAGPRKGMRAFVRLSAEAWHAFRTRPEIVNIGLNDRGRKLCEAVAVVERENPLELPPMLGSCGSTLVCRAKGGLILGMARPV